MYFRWTILVDNDLGPTFQRRRKRPKNARAFFVHPTVQYQAEGVDISILDELLIEKVMGHEINSSLDFGRRHETLSDRIPQ